MNVKVMSFFLCTITSFPLQAFQKAVVKEPVVDVRIHPTDVTELYKRDMDQETQLLYGEHVEILEDHGEWVKIQALEQPDFYGNNKEWGYEKGWIKKGTYVVVDDFPNENSVVTKRLIFIKDRSYDGFLFLLLGTKLNVEKTKTRNTALKVQLVDGREGYILFDEAEDLKPHKKKETIRNQIISTANAFLNFPYRWGGRSPYDWTIKARQRTSVDCSGLVDLCYRVAGLTVPRNSKDQYIGSFPLFHGHALEKGDLIFTARENDPTKISHVMIFEGNDSFIDASESEGKVRRTTGLICLGQPLVDLRSGDEVTINGNKYFIFFGTYFQY